MYVYKVNENRAESGSNKSDHFISSSNADVLQICFIVN